MIYIRTKKTENCKGLENKFRKGNENIAFKIKNPHVSARKDAELLPNSFFFKRNLDHY